MAGCKSLLNAFKYFSWFFAVLTGLLLIEGSLTGASELSDKTVMGGLSKTNSVSPVEKKKVGISSKRLQKFHMLLSDRINGSCSNLGQLKDFVATIDSFEMGYTFYDIAIYYSGLYFHLCGDYNSARIYYQKYLLRRRFDKSIAPFPMFVFQNNDIKKIRKTGVDLQEQISKRWGDYRWAVHFFKPGCLGYEYQQVLSSYAQLCLVDKDASISEFVGAFSKANDNSISQETLRDYVKLLSAIVSEVNESMSPTGIIIELRNSESYNPIPEQLLNTIEDPPSLIWRFRTRGVITLVIILIVFGSCLLLFMKLRTKKHKEEKSKTNHDHYLIHKSDPFMMLVLNRLHLRTRDLFILSLFIMSVGLSAIAWSEGTFWRESHIVDRAFLDYYSFPFGYGFLIPIFFSMAAFFYNFIPCQFNQLFSQIILSKTRDKRDNLDDMPAIKSIVNRYLKFCNSKITTVIILFFVAMVEVAQKWQWIKDGGTAFVDLWYPRYISLTGIYFTVISFIIYYVIISVLLKGGATLIVLSRVFAKKNQYRDKIEPNYDIYHPDNCCGTQKLGVILVLYYFLLIILAAQVALNFVEKFNFYESYDIVLEQTKLSVMAFAAGFFLICTTTVASPLFAIHMSMRRHRYQLLESISEAIKKQQQIIDELIQRNKLEETNIFALDYYRTKWEKARGMPMWPVDMGTISYFGISNLLPVITFTMPLILKKLGIEI